VYIFAPAAFAFSSESALELEKEKAYRDVDFRETIGVTPPRVSSRARANDVT